MHLLIDADSLAYTACFAAEQVVEWEPDVVTITCNVTEAVERFFSLVKEIEQEVREAAPITRTLLVFSCPPYFRASLTPSYKANRKPRSKPVALGHFRKRVASHPDVRQVPTLEADDVIGIIATKPGVESIICSADKDLRTVPGVHWSRSEGALVTVSEDEANHRHLLQTLSGDPSDAYRGCPGIGRIKAEALLKPFWSEDRTAFDVRAAWKAVVEAFEAAGLTAEDALCQARLARVLRWGDWDSETRQPKLWTP